MAKFVQIIQFESDKIDEAIKLDHEYLKATEGKRSVGHALTCADRENPGRYFVIVEFPSYEAAQKNNALPETQEMSEKQMKLSKGAPTFYNLDVLDETN
jgi:quinol monooxygenase YgiN